MVSLFKEVVVTSWGNQLGRTFASHHLSDGVGWIGVKIRLNGSVRWTSPNELQWNLWNLSVSNGLARMHDRWTVQTIFVLNFGSDAWIVDIRRGSGFIRRVVIWDDHPIE